MASEFGDDEEFISERIDALHISSNAPDTPSKSAHIKKSAKKSKRSRKEIDTDDSDQEKSPSKIKKLESDLSPRASVGHHPASYPEITPSSSVDDSQMADEAELAFVLSQSLSLESALSSKKTNHMPYIV